jgi:hypothetical protein
VVGPGGEGLGVSWVVLAGIVLTFGGNVLGWLATRRKIREVHVLVNSNMTEVLRRLGVSQERSGQLEKTLMQADVDVPPKPE